MQTDRSALLGAVVMCGVLCMWIATVVSTAESTMTCPSTPAWVAAGMRITTVTSSSCDKVFSEMKARVDGQTGVFVGPWKDPHNGGVYTVQDYGGSFSTLHSTADGEHLDAQIFTLSLYGVDSCKIEACSRSQNRSFSDDGTNYCNLKMLFCGTVDGCKFIKHDLKFGSEAMQKFSHASVNLRECFGTTDKPTEEVKEAKSEQAGEAAPASRLESEVAAKDPSGSSSGSSSGSLVGVTAKKTSAEKTTGKTSAKKKKKTVVV